MNRPKILTLVPALPPKVNGLGDFAFNLAKSMNEKYDVDTVFLNSDVDNESTVIKYFKIESIKILQRKALIKKLNQHNPEILLINYVGYAYSKHGVPTWLTNVIEEWKGINSDCTIITIFHELYASGWPWQKSFWLMPLQKCIAFRMFKLSDYSIVNTEITYSILHNKDLTKEILFLPVISNINRKEEIMPFTDRDNALVIFGTSSLRNKIFSNLEVLSSWLKFLNIEKIIEIGPYAKRQLSTVNGIPIVYRGVLPEIEISSILIRSKYGMLDYPTHLLSKSGVFAAYACHGVIPIITGDRKISESKVREEEHYLVQPSSFVNYSEMSANLLSWYKQHNVDQLSQVVYDMMEKSKSVK